MKPDLPDAAKRFCEQVGIRYPVIGGPMYPCSNPELTSA
jgi:NAD(P)H-dependent flavin oxidoreductase YrpB (nitropropane dioxygenase family)